MVLIEEKVPAAPSNLPPGYKAALEQDVAAFAHRLMTLSIDKKEKRRKGQRNNKKRKRW